MTDSDEIPLEFLLCVCASAILQGDEVDDTMLLEIYKRLEERFESPTIKETIH
jgi:hypothetical protein